MIKEAIDRIRDLAIAGDEIRTIKHGEQTFASRQLVRVPDEKPVPKVQTIPVATLRGLAAYINDNPDKVDERTFVNVVSPTRVEVLTPVIGEDAARKFFAIAQARLPALQIGQWLTPKDLGVHLRTCFSETPDRDTLVAFLGGIADKAEVQTKDDGVTQTTTVRSGLSMLKEGVVPHTVDLAPFRTFHDIEQPMSAFIFRLDKIGDKVVAAIFEADGGAWQHDAAELVANYLTANVGLKVYA